MSIIQTPPVITARFGDIEEKVVAKIQTPPVITARFGDIEEKVVAKIQTPPVITARFGDISISSGDFEVYKGNYTIIPKSWQQQQLQTAQKVLIKNVVVEKIPTFQTSNDFGGNTFYIGDEIEWQ